MKHSIKQPDGTDAPVLGDAARGTNQSGMRAHNERLVLTLIRQKGALAKSEIARLTGLSAQTVSVIMRALEADGLLEKRAPVRGKVGQPFVPMDLGPQGAYFLGLKVGRRSLDLVLTDFRGCVVDQKHHSHRYPEPDNVVRFANDAIGQVLAPLTPEQRGRVAGLGIAIPFSLWDWAKALDVSPSDMAGWRDRNIATEIATQWDFPVYLRNDASAACGAELVFGDQDAPPDFLYFFIGFFVGGGLVLDNRLYTGPTGNAAALGPMPIVGKDGRRCELIDVASLVALERALLVAGADSDTIWTNPAAWDVPRDILDAWLDHAAHGLAQATLSAACLIDFQRVVIDGWMPQSVRAELVARTLAALADVQTAGIARPEVYEGSIGPDARVLGAASLTLSARFLVDGKLA